MNSQVGDRQRKRLFSSYTEARLDVSGAISQAATSNEHTATSARFTAEGGGDKAPARDQVTANL